MKSVIHGKRYDTDKASKLGEVSHGNPGDWGWSHETLYKTLRSGAYFLHGQGGPRSQYAISNRPGEWSGSSKITPLDRDDAYDWAERNNLAVLLETEFGDKITDA